MEVSNYRLTLRAFECHLDNGVVFKGFFWGGGGSCFEMQGRRRPREAPSTRFGFNDNSKFEKRGNVLCSKFSMTELISLSDDLWLNNEPLRCAELDVLWLQGKM